MSIDFIGQRNKKRIFIANQIAIAFGISTRLTDTQIKSGLCADKINQKCRLSSHNSMNRPFAHLCKSIVADESY